MYLFCVENKISSIEVLKVLYFAILQSKLIQVTNLSKLIAFFRVSKTCL